MIGNPTGKNVSDGVKHYKEKNCDGVIAFGGGSGLDVGKAIAQGVIEGLDEGWLCMEGFLKQCEHEGANGD